MNLLHNVKQLRQRIPIAMGEAHKLLQQTQQDLDQAERIWKEGQVTLLVKKTDLSTVEADELLTSVGYDMTKATKAYRDQQTNDIEKIVASSRSSQRVLLNFFYYIQRILEDQGIDDKIGGWFGKCSFARLPHPIKDIIMVWQWLEYYDGEGAMTEQVITDDVIKVSEQTLGLSAFSQTMIELDRIVEQFYREDAEQPEDPELTKAQRFNKLAEKWALFAATPEFVRLMDQIKVAEEPVKKTLVDYLDQHSDEINQIVQTQLLTTD